MGHLLNRLNRLQFHQMPFKPFTSPIFVGVGFIDPTQWILAVRFNLLDGTYEYAYGPQDIDTISLWYNRVVGFDPNFKGGDLGGYFYNSVVRGQCIGKFPYP